MKTILLFFIFLISLTINAQEMKTNQLPYDQIPEYSKKYTAGSVVARMIDGLGFRYYWATEGLRSEDLAYAPSKNGRKCEQTIDHIFSLSTVIVNAATETINDSAVKQPEMTYAEKRKKTLENLKKASDILRVSEDVAKFKVIFKSGNGNTEYPFWNAINGPIADALWHTGQIVLMRRASGNPFNSKVNVLTGKLRE